ncbi:hypothetical protein JCM11641_000337 [Rhodosporidiobolus odoratus]
MATHHGFIEEFPFIRIDAFDGDPALVNPYTGLAPHFYLLTHAHTDHITGLDSPHFSGQIYATPLTKQLILETMTAADRVRYEELGSHIRKNRKFANLTRCRSAISGGRGRGIDRIKEIPLNTPTLISGPDGTSVTVTALDANHCPGSCMFLIEGPSPSAGRLPRAILHTGDLRAEAWWLDSLRHNPLIQPFLAPPLPCPPPTMTTTTKGKGKGRATDVESERIELERRGARGRARGKVLDCVYLDTSCVLVDEELVPKEEAVDALVELISLYPPDTRFFLNAWTWGYEEMLKGVYQAFGEEIHLDWYKHKIYTSSPFRTAEPLLASLGTTSSYPTPPSPSTPAPPPEPSPSLRAPPSSLSSVSELKTKKERNKPPPFAPPAQAPLLRFHACERRWRCDHVWASGIGCYAWEEEYLPCLEGPKRFKTFGGAGGGGGGGGVGLRRDGGTEQDGQGGKVVFVNPCEMTRWRWEAYKEDLWGRVEEYWEEETKIGTKGVSRDEVHDGQQGKGKGKGKGGRKSRGAEGEGKKELPKSLISPLARHSTLPELQRLIALFRPRTLYPLTIAPPTPQHPAYDYCALPSLFGPFLDPEGGETRLRAEAQAHKKGVLENLERRRRGKGRVLDSSPEEVEGGDADGGLVASDWVKEMEKRKMNVEGGWEAFREVEEWCVKLEKGEKKRGEAERKEKRGQEEVDRDEVLVLVLDTDGEEEAKEEAGTEDRRTRQMQLDEENASPTTTSSLPVRRQSTRDYDLSRREAELGRRPSPFLDAATSTALLSSASIDSQTPSPSPPLRSVLSRRDRTPEPTIGPATVQATTTSIGQPLRKSVTWAASPSPRQSTSSTSKRPFAPTGLSSPELGVSEEHMPKKKRPGLAHNLQDLFSSSSNAASPNLSHLGSASTTSTTSTTSAPTANARVPTPMSPPQPLQPIPIPTSSSLSGPPPPPVQPIPPTKKPLITARPSAASRPRRRAITAALKRSIRGEVMKDGGVRPFEEGDERLGGRRALPPMKIVAKGKGREEGRVLREVQEEGTAVGAGVETTAWTSPSSFRTVGASVSVSP